MPPKGFRKKQPLTADDYSTGGELCNYAANILAVVARKHQVPELLAAVTLANQASEKLYAQRNQADQRHSLPVVPPPPDADRPDGEANRS